MKPSLSGPEIVMLAGGGVAHVSGGVGTLILYLMEEWASGQQRPVVRVIDTRGRGGVGGAALCFVRACATLIWLRMLGRVALVHAHMTTRGSVVRKCILCGLSRLLGLPIIMHMHGADFMGFYRALARPYRWMIGVVLRQAKSVVVLGHAWRQFLTRELGVDGARIALVANGVRGPRLQHVGSRKPGAHLVFLGRLGARKGVPELLAALASPQMMQRNWQATIAGDGDVAGFRAEAERLGLSGRVTMPGWLGRDAAAGLLAEADILVLPSHHEAMPIAIIEALAHHVAVVATPVGVIDEFLTNGETALLVPPGDWQVLADALVQLIDDPGQRQRIAAAGHRVFVDRLDIAVVAARMQALYGAALHGGRHAA